jgi:MFS family permease
MRRNEVLLIYAIARTFEQPVMQSLVTVMAPRPVLSRAINAYISAGRLSILLGPSLGGVLYVFGADVVYGICTLLILAAAGASFLLPDPPVPAERLKLNWDSLIAGFRFIWRCQAVLAAMSFDLIASLLGSVNALLPIYARDILDVGSWGAGALRSAPVLGALAAAAVLARFPVQRRGGLFIYVGLVLYGLAVIVFGLSQNVVLSITALMLLGCGDMVSSVVRQTVVQVTTPDEMRGRVGGVNSFFQASSGQLGGFRAGLTAEWLCLSAKTGIDLAGHCRNGTTIAREYPKRDRLSSHNSRWWASSAEPRDPSHTIYIIILKYRTP